MEVNQSSSTRVNPLTLSSDEGEAETCLPMIVNTVSLHGTAFTFDEEQAEVSDNPLYPECEIKEESNENEDTQNTEIATGSKSEKRRVSLTSLGKVDRPKVRKPKPSTSRINQNNVVDSKKLALQENMFKTKELFDTFLRVCQDQETSDQMEKVVQRMIRTYEKTKHEFLGSRRLQQILEEETEKVNTSNIKPWLNLKFVLDEMKNNKKQVAPKLKLGESEESQDPGGYDDGDDEPVIECPKKRRHVKKLEKCLRAINLKIKQLEEREVDLDDEDDSAYLKLDRYRAQFVKVHKKVCEIKGKLDDAERPYLRKVSFAGTTYPHLNRCIERYYNKHREFPDFQDIKKLVTKANEQEGISMPPIKIHSIAQEAFKEFGEMLKRLRQYDDYDVMVSYLDQHVDPARDDEELQEQLNKNAILFKKREQEVINKFAEKDAGLYSESDDSSSGRKPVKKKQNLIIATTSRKTSSKPKRKLSDVEEDVEQPQAKKKKKPVLSGSSSSSESSDSDSGEKRKKKVVNGKGKALIGKSRVIKKGKLSGSPKIDKKRSNVFSSDEETVPVDTKDAFADYLGLQGKSSEVKSENISKVKEESEDEITCLKEIKSSPELSKNENKTKYKSETKSKELLETEPPNHANSKSKTTNVASDDEPMEVKEQVKSKRKSSKDSSDESNTSSDEESDVEEKSKHISDVELSPDSSDDEESKTKPKKKPDTDSPVIVLSEDVPLTSKAPEKQIDLSPDSSDSDDIFILSQESKQMKKVVPRRKSTEDKFQKNQNAIRSANSLSKRATPPLRRKPGMMTSTPKRMAVSKKRTLASSPKRPDAASASERRFSPQVVNKAPRKVVNKRISPPPPNESKYIPIIELD